MANTNKTHGITPSDFSPSSDGLYIFTVYKHFWPGSWIPEVLISRHLIPRFFLLKRNIIFNLSGLEAADNLVMWIPFIIRRLLRRIILIIMAITASFGVNFSRATLFHHFLIRSLTERRWRRWLLQTGLLVFFCFHPFSPCLSVIADRKRQRSGKTLSVESQNPFKENMKGNWTFWKQNTGIG